MSDALQYAQYLEGFYVSEDVSAVKARAIAATLRAQHAELTRLRALTAPPAPVVPARWQLEMIAAMAVIDSSGTCNGTPTVGMAGADEAYAAMLAAAPQAAPQPTQKD